MKDPIIIAAALLAIGMFAIAGAIAKLADSIIRGTESLQRMLSGVLATASKILLAQRNKIAQ